MNIAILVLAHNAPQVLRETLSCLKGDSFSFWIHLDRKANIAEYQAALGETDYRVRFTQNRTPVFWGGFNMIRATESIASDAIVGSPADAFILISDDSLPLFDGERIKNLIGECKDRFDDHPVAAGSNVWQRYSEFFYLDSYATSARWTPTENRRFHPDDIAAIRRMALRKEKGKTPFHKLCAGSQWWCMSRELLEASINTLRTDTDLRESFEFSAIPDELVFQTLGRIHLPPESHKKQSPMLVDFSREPKPYIFDSLPEGFEPKDHHLFIRKIKNESAKKMMKSIMNGNWHGKN